MIDSHCHLNFPFLKNNFQNIIKNSIKNNITAILTISTNPKDFTEHLNLIKNYRSIFISYGLHPDAINDTTRFTVEDLIKNTKNNKVIAIGETGLDFYHSIEFKNKQYEVLETHIEASIKTKLPLIIHQRNSENEIMNVFNSYKKKHKLNIVFHCFTGSKDFLNFCIDNEYYISLSGIITFKNSDNLREVIKNLPLKFLLIETDSPFLAPIPMRGKSNEPSYVKYTANYLSNFYNISLDKLIEITDNNFYELFSKAKRYNYF